MRIIVPEPRTRVRVRPPTLPVDVSGKKLATRPAREASFIPSRCTHKERCRRIGMVGGVNDGGLTHPGVLGHVLGGAPSERTPAHEDVLTWMPRRV